MALPPCVTRCTNALPLSDERHAEEETAGLANCPGARDCRLGTPELAPGCRDGLAETASGGEVRLEEPDGGEGKEPEKRSSNTLSHQGRSMGAMDSDERERVVFLERYQP